MDTDNSEYRNAYTTLHNAGRPYSSGGPGTGQYMGQDACCNICQAIMCLDCCTGGCCC